jgi:RNA recognition motif-containing protein
MVRTKVFVGNLDFNTKEAELVTQFSTAGKVISANIITRGPRSLGYGFVEMDSEEDAQKAVAALNKKEIDGRPINVEVAKPRDETQKGAEAQPNAPRGGRGRGGRRGRGGFRGGRGGRGGAAAPAPGGAAPAPAPGAQQPAQPKPARGGAAPRGAPKPKRAPAVPEAQREQSKTTLFVANLPFKLDDENFTKFLKDNAVTFKAAHVVTNQRSGRSKGFGFIEFENEADQQKALAALNKKVVDERELIVKVALAQPPEQQAAPSKQEEVKA